MRIKSLTFLTLFAALLGGATFVNAQKESTDEAWQKLLAANLRLYPLANAADIYKFTYQSVFGPGHMIPNRAVAEEYLQRELASLQQGIKEEPLVEELCSDPPLVRINLRPYVAADYSGQVLLDGLVASANLVKGDPMVMAQRLSAAIALLNTTGRTDDAKALAKLAEEQKSLGYQAIHHSDAYTKAYAPAYRLVLRSLVPLAKTQGDTRKR